MFCHYILQYLKEVIEVSLRIGKHKYKLIKHYLKYGFTYWDDEFLLC